MAIGGVVIDSAYLLALHHIFGLHLNRYFRQLYTYFGSWEEVWKTCKTPVQLGIPSKLWDEFFYAKKQLEPHKIYEALLIKGINWVTCIDKNFPKLLLQIHNIPCILYYCGDLSLCTKRTLAIVGSRKATNYGLEQAKYMALELAQRGLVIVSGLALGIDTQAHIGALECGGGTIAVLGSGLNNVYPRNNISLFADIINKGLVISEFPPDTQPAKMNFPIRNRIISGLSEGVFVVEALLKSGSLITCDLALEQGRDVYALPGPVDSPNSLGPLSLIQNGAKAIINPEDILEEYGHNTRKSWVDIIK